MNDIFELEMFENLKRSIKRYVTLFTFTVIFTYMVLLISMTLFTYIIQ